MKNKKISGLIAAVIIILSMLVPACTNETKPASAEPDNSTTIQTTTQEETEPPFEPTDINLMMIGDMLIHEGVRDSGAKEDGTYNYDHLFRFIGDDIKWADMALVNQEVILGGSELGLTGYPCFNGAYELGDALVNAGFNIVLHGTNHALDKGQKGIDNCLNYWHTNHPDVGVLGINQTEEDTEKIYVYEKNGIKVAVLNYTYGTNGIRPPEDRPYIVNYLEEERVVKDIQKAKEISDFVIVCPHWGIEYTLEEVEEQTKWAQIFADNGADLVIGTHPHVIEPVKWVEGRNGNKMLVYYSLGNFVSNQDRAPRMLGAMAKVVISNDEDGHVFIKSYGVEPLVTHQLKGFGQMGTYRLSDYTPELAAQNRIKGMDPGFSYDYLTETSAGVFGDLYQEGQPCVMKEAGYALVSGTTQENNEETESLSDEETY